MSTTWQWDTAWDVTSRSFAFTNHTLLPEALEKWSVDLFGRILPRHLEIIYEINRRFLDQVRVKFMGDEGHLERLSLIDESGGRSVRMANLACVGSYSINGVAALHTELVKSTILKDFYELSPEKFNNKTNGVTPRRWLVQANPRLTNLISSKIGDNWIKHLHELKGLEQYADDSAFPS
jgi:starch phosphorylase